MHDCTHRVGVSDGGLQQTLVVGSGPWGNNFQSWDRSVPSAEVLRVLSTDTGSGTVRTSESDGTRDVSTGHVVGLSSRVDDLVDRLHGEVPGHWG